MNTSIRLPISSCNDLKKLVESSIQLCGNNLQKVVLFGSFATNKYQPDSDYDICLVFYQLPPSNTERQAIRNMGEYCNIDRKVDVVICSQEDLENGNMVFKYIRRDGVILYEQI